MSTGSKAKIPTREIPTPILDILAGCTSDGNTVFLPPGQLDRQTYTAVNKVLESLGGKWNRYAKGHVFDSDPAEMLADVVTTGQYHNPDDLGWFPTPPVLAAQIIDLADIRTGHEVLEPSAGEGALAIPMAELVGGARNVTCCEIDKGRGEHLLSLGFAITPGVDFLEFEPMYRFDRIVMNPPFARQQDIDHVMHAWSLLKDGGRLVSIMSMGTAFRQTSKAVAFRELVDRYGRMEPNADDAFRESGTLVRTVTIVLDKAAS